MSKKVLSLLLALCLLSGCTKAEEAPVEIPQEPAVPEEVTEVPIIQEQTKPEEQLDEIPAVTYREVILDINAGDWEFSDYQRVSLSCPENMSLQSMGAMAQLYYQEKYDACLFLYRDEDGSMFQSQRYLQVSIGDIRDAMIPGKTAVLQVKEDTFQRGDEILQRDIYWLKLDGYCLKLQISVPQNDPNTISLLAKGKHLHM